MRTLKWLFVLAALTLLAGLALRPVAPAAAGPTRQETAPPAAVPSAAFTDIRSIDAIDVLRLPAIDNAALIAEDVRNFRPDAPPRYAVPVAVKVAPTTHGTWEDVGHGLALWRLRVQSADAHSLSLGFTTYAMPPGGELFVYSAATDGAFNYVRGPFTAADNELHGELWTPIVLGDDIIIEIVLPAAQRADLGLELTSVQHAYVEFGDFSHLLSGSCNLDVVCGAADGYPEVDAWRDQIRSVAVISTGGSTFCTGFLVNNTAQDLTPYFMTANHCGINAGNAPSLVVYWNYENSWCRPPGSAASGGPGDGSLSQFQSGSFFRASYSPSDFTLVELDEAPNEDWNVHWAGWDARNQATSSAVAIHHPSTDEKRISFEDDPTFVSDYLGTTPNPNGTHITVVDWDLGTTEPGSSGSPLFSPEGRVIGQLHGGYAACGNDLLDSYGRMASSWNGGGGASNRLIDWLDPIASGALTLDGTDQYGYKLTVTPATVNVCAGTNAVFTVDVISQGGFVDPVTLSTDSGGSFSVNPVVPTGSSDLTIVTTGTPAGSYPFTVSGSGGGLDRVEGATYAVFTGAPGAPTLTAPANGAGDVSLLPAFTWNAGAQSATYDIGVFTSPSLSLGSVVDYALGLDTTMWTPNAPLDPLTTYYWAVRAKNPCGQRAVSAVFSFTTRNIPPVLLVDDDDNNPNVQSTYVAALTAAGLDYDIWDTSNSDNEPDAAYLSQYNFVVWFSGDEFGGAAGPGATGETALASYLDDYSGCLFISSQDYYWDRGLTGFMTGYLGISAATSDVSQTSVTGAIPNPPFGGTHPLSYPFTNYSDRLTAGNGGVALYNGNQGLAAVYKLGPTYQTTFWGFPLEALPVAEHGPHIAKIYLACQYYQAEGIDLLAP